VPPDAGRDAGLDTGTADAQAPDAGPKGCLIPRSTDPVARDLPGELAAEIAAALEAHRVPSASIAVMRDGEWLGLQAFGEADPLASIRASVDTPYALGSLSKPLLGVLIHQLVEEGLDIDTEVSGVLGVSVRSTSHPDAPITIRHLLTHTASIADLPFTYDGRYYVAGDSPIAFADFVLGYFDPASPYFGGAGAFTDAAPGSEICYSNMGAALLGVVIERVTGSTLPDVARQRIFEPLRMSRTSYLVGDFCETGEFARGCDVSGGELVSADNGAFGQPESHPELASGVVRSTAADIARFVSAIGRGGELEGARVLRSDSVSAMLATSLPAGFPSCGDGRVVPEHMSHMWIHYPFAGEDYVGHYGGIYGFYTTAYVRPSDQLVIAILLNRISLEAMSRIETLLLAAY
jgi:CubicO group peptidase (beta-lactamase class C family)